MAAPKSSKTAKKSATKKVAAKKPAAKKAAATKPASKKAAAKKPAASKPAAKKAPAKKPAAKKPAAKKAAPKKPAANKPAVKKVAAKRPADKKAAANKPATAKKAAVKKAAAKTSVSNKSTANKSAAKKTSAKKTSAKKSAAAKKAAADTTPRIKQAVPPKPTPKAKKKKSSIPSLLSNAVPDIVEVPKPRGKSKDGISYTKDFDVKFLKSQKDELLARRASEMARATRLEDEATSLIEDGEMGDVQFDDEGGEGDTMVVQRDLDRLLSGQARQTVGDIDEALARIEEGTYGYSAVSGKPIPRERLEAIPETTVLAVEKVSGAGFR